MKMVVDGRMENAGGVGTYLRQIVAYLSQVGRAPHVLTPDEVKSPIYSLKEQLELPRRIDPCDLFWSPHFNTPIFPILANSRVVTIHDLYHLDHPERFPRHQRLYAKALYRAAVARANLIITVSEFSSKRLIHHFPSAANKVQVIHSGCDHLSFAAKKPEISLARPFFLFVGNLKPHKNLEVILKALTQFPGLDLVVAGQTSGFIHGVDRKELMRRYPSLKKRIHFLGKVSDGELSWLYQSAEALIFPSLYEGWGLPPLEAMRFGCPVIASTAASIPEACGEGALYFAPTSVAALREAMADLPIRRSELIRLGRERAAHFSWKKAGKEHHLAFRKVVEASLSRR